MPCRRNASIVARHAHLGPTRACRVPRLESFPNVECGFKDGFCDLATIASKSNNNVTPNALNFEFFRFQCIRHRPCRAVSCNYECQLSALDQGRYFEMNSMLNDVHLPARLCKFKCEFSSCMWRILWQR